MSLEDITAGSTIADFVTTNPATGDSRLEGDDHLRNIKKGVQQTFMNLSATVSSVAAELDFAHKGGSVSGTAVLMETVNCLADLSVSGAAALNGGVSIAGGLSVQGVTSASATVIIAGLRVPPIVGIMATSGVLSFNPAGISATKSGSGLYQISHGLGTTDYVLELTPRYNSPGNPQVPTVGIRSVGSNTVKIHSVLNTDSLSAYTDAIIHFAIWQGA